MRLQGGVGFISRSNRYHHHLLTVPCRREYSQATKRAMSTSSSYGITATENAPSNISDLEKLLTNDVKVKVAGMSALTRQHVLLWLIGS